MNMKSLGEYLRSERLNRGITLEEISRETRISTRMLQAIEDGNTESLPAGVLVKGFLRAYAQKIMRTLRRRRNHIAQVHIVIFCRLPYIVIQDRN